jgi:integrase
MQISTFAPVGTLFTPGGQRKDLTPSERARFIAAAMEHPRPLVRTLCLTLAYTGCRISEALNLFVGSIETQEDFVAIRSLKKRKKMHVIRQVPLPEHIIELIIETHIGYAAANRLWPWSRSRAWQLVKSVMGDAGIAPGPYATPKGLRHAFGVHAIRSGIPINLVQRWMGHASMTTTAIYLDVIGDEERELAQRMWQ